MDREKELAYRYDLFITPDWRDRFDTLVNESIKLPTEGRILDVNCGTGAHAIEIAERLKGRGEIVGVDPSAERLELARAKAQVKKLNDVAFEQALASDLPFESDQFDMVIGDASMAQADEIEDLLTEMVRVAQPDARVILKMATHGSFDEFFSIYWEALNDLNLVEEVWSALESLINERVTVTDAEQMARRLGLRHVESFISKEEFLFETGKDFVNSPLIEDVFLEDWLEVAPEERRNEVRERIVSIIERERHNAPFDISIKATLIAGVK
ncbi:MAG TPA: class I SAM-dependent methyltransferase [Blastocatellia bacterium]|nr:class I SAM-dependent methyltransferase [Blastocatellia bacterium]